MKFSLNDNEADSRRRAQSARSGRGGGLTQRNKQFRGKSAPFHSHPFQPAKKTTMPTTSYKKPVTVIKEKDQGIIVVTDHGDLNGNNRLRLTSESSSVSVKCKASSAESKNTLSPSAALTRPCDGQAKKSSPVVRRSPKEVRKRSESVTSDSTECSKTAAQKSTAWDAFDEHVKNINDSSDYYTKQQKISFKASDTFQKTMLDLYGKPEYGKTKGLSKFRAKVGTITSLAYRFSKACNRNAENGDSEEQSDCETPDLKTVENARRGWRILRRYVQDQIAQKKGSAASLNWSVLQQTMRGMSDMEKTRIDLYKRYGIIPTVNSDGTVVQENTMLSERARAQLLNASKNSVLSGPVPLRRVHSHGPPSWNLRSSYQNVSKTESYKKRRPKSSQNP